ncbi:VCBS repeat-containing protein, partial [bacterium]|nr:VCBS repeat-containing protein [bacterium]
APGLAIAVFGGHVIAAGGFDYAGDEPVHCIAQWDGSTWSDMGGGLTGGFDYKGNCFPWYCFPTENPTMVYALRPSGGWLYAAGEFKTAGSVVSKGIARWNGTQWSAVGTGTNDVVLALAGSGGQIFAGGKFMQVGALGAHHAALWNGSYWSGFGNGQGFSQNVRDLCTDGSVLYAGGVFDAAGNTAANLAACYAGGQWAALGDGITGSGHHEAGDYLPAEVNAVYHNGSALFAGGYFNTAGSDYAHGFGKWANGSWEGMNPPIWDREDDYMIHSLAGNSQSLFMAGRFLFTDQAQGIFEGKGVVQWDGSQYTGILSRHDEIMDLGALAWIDGSLYAGEVYWTPSYQIDFDFMRWTGSTWISLATGLNERVACIHEYGDCIVVGGLFTEIGGQTLNHIALWNGSSFAALGSGLNGNVSALGVMGSQLYVAGHFTQAGGEPAQYTAVWNGDTQTWSGLGSGLDGPVNSIAIVGNDVYFSGTFTEAGGSISSCIACWHTTGVPVITPVYPHLGQLVNTPFQALNDASIGSAWGDYDGDGDADLFVANDGGENNGLYRNDGGSYTALTGVPPVSDSGWSWAGAWGDMDNDGDNDLYVANLVGVNFLYRNDGGTLTRILSGAPVTDEKASRGCAWADVDNDGDLDLFVANTGGQNNGLYLNGGNGAFTAVVSGPVVTDGGYSVMGALTDADRDGDADLFVANNNGENNFFYTNNGDGTFTKIIAGSIVTDGGESWSASWGDYDNDGYPDLFVANNAEVNFLYHNDGSGHFTRIWSSDVVTQSQHSRSGVWADMDNDGDLDLFVANKDEENRLFMNLGQGSFRRYTLGVSDARGASVADDDLDGDMDLFVCNDGTPDQLWRNMNADQHHWLEVMCEGVESNRSGIGVKVRIRTLINGVPVHQVREIMSQTGFGGGSELMAHFGLSDATIVDSLVIQWPGGTVWDTTGVAVNQRLRIRERTSVLPPNRPPVAMNDSVTVMQDSPITVPVLLNDTDPDGDALVIQSVDAAGIGGSVEIGSGDTTLTYTPETGFTGNEQFDYVISDGNGGLDTAMVRITVQRMNHPPVAVDDTLTVPQDSMMTVHVLENDWDPDGDAFSIIGLRNPFCSCIVSIDPGDTTLALTPPSGFSGELYFDYMIMDEYGAMDTATVHVTVTPATSVKTQIPLSCALYQNHPNPFNPSTVIRYDLSRDSRVRVTVYDVVGKEVAEIVNTLQSAGTYQTEWNGCDRFGRAVPSGVYFYRIEAGEFVRVRKMLMVR